MTASTTYSESNNVTDRIGNTPLIQLKSFSTDNVKIYAKLEWYNPFGSVKDRAAYWMIKNAEEKKILRKDKSIIIEPTSGNTGIALAGIASYLGYKVEIVIPEKVSKETKDILRKLGVCYMRPQMICAREWVLVRIRASPLLTLFPNQDQMFTICQIGTKMILIIFPIFKFPDPKYGNKPMEK